MGPDIKEEDDLECKHLYMHLGYTCNPFIFKIFPMLMKYRILLLGNTVEMAGG